jgi:hypothetical protein
MSEDNPALLFREAILACRAEQWRHGLDLLTRVAHIAERRGNLPGAFYSYLGLAMARVEGRKQEGMQLCRHALEAQPGEVDNHINLATLYLFMGRRHSAFVLVERARRWFPDNARVAALHERLGIRKPSVFPFLSRRNPCNVLVGRARHWWILQFNEAKAKREEQIGLSDDTASDT